MKLQYLGTAAAEGWPALFCRCPVCKEARKRGGKNLRTRSQAIVDDTLLLDFCPETYMHMLVHDVDLPNLKTCLLTHTHEDHFYIDDVMMRCPWFANNVDDVPFTFYGNDEMVRRLEEFRSKPDGEIFVQGMAWKELTEYERYDIGLWHVTPTIARHNPKEKCFNYIIEKDGKTLFYAHDTGYFTEETWQHLLQYHYDFVSLDCTMLVRKVGGTHMSIQECVQVRERLLDNGCADSRTGFCINHFSHNGGYTDDGKIYLHEELVPYMAERGFLVSYDGMVIEF